MSRCSTLLAAALVALALCRPAAAHLCMWDPPQRGGYDIGGPAEASCYRKVGPCGTDEAGPTTIIQAGSPYTVRFQQNANHYYTGKPGQLVIDWAKTQGTDFGAFTELLSIPDYNPMGELTQTNFTKTVTIPDAECDNCVLRVRYISNNPDEDPQGHGPTFYQCANVKFAKPATTASNIFGVRSPAAAVDTATQQQRPHAQPLATAKNNACCAPESFTTNYFMNKQAGPSKGTIYYDAANHMMREDVVHGAGVSGTFTDGSFQIFMNFTSGKGYLYNVNTGECPLGHPFPLDQWNEWCFGSVQESQKYTRSGVCQAPATGFCNYYADGDFEFGSTQDQCLPASILGHEGDQASVVYYGAQVGTLSRSTFAPPASCLEAEAASEAGRRAQQVDWPVTATAMRLASLRHRQA